MLWFLIARLRRMAATRPRASDGQQVIPEYARFRQTRFFGSLDGLRAVSIAGVIWFHCWWGTPYYSRLESIPVLRQGSFGIHIFFVISGFLITTLLLREQDRFGRISVRDFYIRRALRIWPLYYAMIGLYIVLVLIVQRGSREGTFFHYLPYFLTYTYTWFISPHWPTGPFNLAWTLSTEEQFYFFWPLLLRFFRGAWPAVTIVSLIVLRTATADGWTSHFLRTGWLPTRIVLSTSVAICMGVLLAQALHSERCFRWLWFVLGQKWSAPAAAAATALCLYPPKIAWWGAFLTTTSLVGACTIREDNGLARLLRFRPIAYMGVLSYGMYLLNSVSAHAVELPLSALHLQNPLLVFPLALVFAMGAAFLSYHYFESRFLRLKTRFSRLQPERMEGTPEPVPAAQAGFAVEP
jgi:peptidoglycan/LPS O-acetylase OafA/YrhL